MNVTKKKTNVFSLLLSAKQGNSNSHRKKRQKKTPQRTYVSCPICTCQVIVENVSQHIDFNCKGPPTEKRELVVFPTSDTKNEKKSINDCSKSDAPAADQLNINHNTQPEGDKAAKTETNAFSKLMQAARIQPRQEHFSLYQTEDGRLAWKWVVLHDGLSATKSEIQIETGIKPASWECDVPIKETTIGGKLGKLVLATNMPSAGTPSLFQKYLERTSRFSVPVLKSLLQKNVRRGRAEAAVRVAFELMVKSWTDFIRRIVIIMLEDSMLHPSVPILVWLMVADSRGYTPSQIHIEACLQIVHEISQCKWQDAYDLDIDQPVPVSKDLDCLPPQEAAICRAILCRMRYGGMACDCALLKYFVWKWKERLSSLPPAELAPFCASSSHTAQPILALKGDRHASQESGWLSFLVKLHDGAAEFTMDSLLCDSQIIRKQDAIPSGIDFHVSSVIEDLVRNRVLCTQIQNEIKFFRNNRISSSLAHHMIPFLKKAMWECSGSLNVRSQIFVDDTSSSLREYRDMCQKDLSIGVNYKKEEELLISVAVSDTSRSVWALIKSHVNHFQNLFISSHLLCIDASK